MMAGWSASAVAGGFLLDHHGFGFTFIITAVLQARHGSDQRGLGFGCVSATRVCQAHDS